MGKELSHLKRKMGWEREFQILEVFVHEVEALHFPTLPWAWETLAHMTNSISKINQSDGRFRSVEGAGIRGKRQGVGKLYGSKEEIPGSVVLVVVFSNQTKHFDWTIFEK